MSALLEKPFGKITPSETESRQAGESSRQLARYLGADLRVQVQTDATAASEPVVLPASAVSLLLRLLAEMAQGNAVMLVPIHAELTTQQAAEILGVSRPFVIDLLDRGIIPHRKVGTHRRIRAGDLLAFQEKSEAQRAAALQALVDEGQELGMGY